MNRTTDEHFCQMFGVEIKFDDWPYYGILKLADKQDDSNSALFVELVSKFGIRVQSGDDWIPISFLLNQLHDTYLPAVINQSFPLNVEIPFCPVTAMVFEYLARLLRREERKS